MTNPIKAQTEKPDDIGQVVAKGTSPASTGPAGGFFEGQVGASFLLSLLVCAEPRGLPGTIIDRVEFQRAAEGHPLDDIVVHAHDVQGKPAVLEVQVKKGINFSPSDPIFRSIVGQIAQAPRKPELPSSAVIPTMDVPYDHRRTPQPFSEIRDL